MVKLFFVEKLPG